MFIEHMFGVLYQPDQQWKRIKEENYTALRCYLSHMIYLAAIPPLAAFIGSTQMGWSLGGGNLVKLTTASALPIAIAFYFALLVGSGIMAWFIHWMEKTYGSNSSFDDCMVLTTFTASPLFLSGLAALIPVIWIDVVIGMVALAFCVRLLYTGVPVIMKIPTQQGFIFSTSIMTVGLVVLVGMLATTAVLWGTVMSPTFISA